MLFERAMNTNLGVFRSFCNFHAMIGVLALLSSSSIFKDEPWTVNGEGI